LLGSPENDWDNRSRKVVTTECDRLANSPTSYESFLCGITEPL